MLVQRPSYDCRENHSKAYGGGRGAENDKWTVSLPPDGDKDETAVDLIIELRAPADLHS